MDMVRAGVMFYGIYPGPEVQRTVDVALAATWIARVVQSKITLAGQTCQLRITVEPGRTHADHHDPVWLRRWLFS